MVYKMPAVPTFIYNHTCLSNHGMKGHSDNLSPGATKTLINNAFITPEFYSSESVTFFIGPVLH